MSMVIIHTHTNKKKISYPFPGSFYPAAQLEFLNCYAKLLPRWWLHLIVVRRFEYASDPESYTSGSVATGRVSLAGQVKG